MKKKHIFYAEKDQLIEELREANLATLDLSRDEVAKLHLRHTVGGRNPDLANERLIRFVFPERPGALMHFLSAMSPAWNISLFHYRNQGGDAGRVLAGIQVPPADEKAFTTFLNTLDYPWVDDTQNAACKLFL